MLFVIVVKVPFNLNITLSITLSNAYSTTMLQVCRLNCSINPEIAIVTTAFNECNHFNSRPENFPPSNCLPTNSSWVRVKIWVRFRGNILGGNLPEANVPSTFQHYYNCERERESYFGLILTKTSKRVKRIQSTRICNVGPNAQKSQADPRSKNLLTILCHFLVSVYMRIQYETSQLPFTCFKFNNENTRMMWEIFLKLTIKIR